MLSEIIQTEKAFNCGISDESGFSNSLDNLVKQNGFCKGEGWGDLDLDMDSFGFDIGFFGDDNNKTVEPGHNISKYHTDQQLLQFADIGSSDYLFLDVVPTPVVSGDNEFKKNIGIKSQNSMVIEPEKQRSWVFPSSSLEILNKYGSRHSMSNCTKRKISCTNGSEWTMSCDQTTLSIETTIQLAAEKFIQSTSQISNELSMLSHPYPSSIMCQLEEDSKGVQLVQNLLSCAEKVRKHQYDSARKLLQECDRMSSPEGNPVQRLAFYFAEGLCERIDRETGRTTSKGLGEKVKDPLEALKSPDAMLIAFHKELPLSQITKFAGIQAIVEHVSEARKVHVIDFEIRKGIQWTILMQALATRSEHPVEYLKISAVGTKSKASIEETGRQLTSFAQSLNLKFSFNVVMVVDILHLNESHFERDADEAISVYAAYTLTYMIGQSNQLEHLMRVIKAINPCVMIVTEVEANCNSPIFVDRFVEALFFYGACFESMADCMKNDEKNRRLAESTCFSSAIRNIVAAEGKERKIRHVSISVWRAFFTCFGLKETELSMSSKYQANLVLENFNNGNSYTFNIDGKSLIIGWKGTPVSSLSAWKFQSHM